MVAAGRPGSAPGGRGGISDRPGSAPDARAYFLLLRQKKVAKEKATLGRRPLRGCPALLELRGCCATRRCAARTVLAPFPRNPALLGASQGARTAVANSPAAVDWRSIPKSATSFGSPCGAPSNGDGPGVVGRRCLSRAAASLAGRPVRRVAQGIRRSRPRSLGWPSFWLLFLGHPRKSTPAGQRRNTAHQKSLPFQQAKRPLPAASPRAGRQPITPPQATSRYRP